jgi:hypothetical protein
MTFNQTNSVDESVAKAALAAVEGHPLQQEAVQWPHCPSDVFETGKRLVDGARFPVEIKAGVQAALADVDTVLVVGYWTASRKPEPLSGGGKHYVFMLHPRSLKVLHADVGSWRS